MNHEVEVRESGDENGLVVLSDHEPGGLVLSIPMPAIQDFPTRTSVQVGQDQHVEVGATLAFMNHSSDPTCRIHVSGGDLQVICVRSMTAGDEVTFNYNTTEYSMAEPFVDRETGELIAGWHHLSSEEKDELKPMALEYLYDSEVSV